MERYRYVFLLSFTEKFRFVFFATTLLLFSGACRQNRFDTNSMKEADYLRQVGDISFDSKLDDQAFQICNEHKAKQYYNFNKGLLYEGEKKAIDTYFHKNFKGYKENKESGYVTIRFIVNCRGETGRFRVKGIDENYQVKQFNHDLVAQLLKLTKALDGWMAGDLNGEIFDYYQYLTFKITDGQLIEIMP